ncbi:N-acetylmuramoyl-L-alanine amidase [Planomonospora sp. ID67723]|uniref:N-acetylmuramoyl-L-alanine amidase n=1 Tax=Planomonospora sp. ID67723 TaxID=2738134 RepID=UPI0018C368B3|nr:peptidoglycan recognition family protein [Planomonospora sp. ID67723]MBG0831143.1 N-acetylmuramoyl-L-alanine amidase [Planomonospora sp. ID67723]
MRHLSGIAALAALVALVPTAPGTAALRPEPSGSRQAAFAQAARAYGVPESVLLAVSYLESRWDRNDGLPSVSGGYGPMHLVDAGLAVPGDGDHYDGRSGGDSDHPGDRPNDHHSDRPGDHHGGGEDPRGDETRPMVRPARAPEPAADPPSDTLRLASRLTGIPPARLRDDPAANIRGGAALLAEYRRREGGTPGGDPARWYGAVARYAASDDAGAAAAFADEVYATIRAGAARTTDDGERVVLPPDPSAVPPAPATGRLGLHRAAAPGPDCPPTISCRWLPAPYQRLGRKGRYGNHDRYDGRREIDYIVIHDGESSYRSMVNAVRNPRYLSWHFTLRSGDGLVAQHLRGQDIGWHAGNWDVNSRSIGLEHEGYVARGGSWYTEAMYRASAKLVRHLARKYGVPLDRAHIVGHDNVPGTTRAAVRGMHTDPGPYWDWARYFALLGSPPARAARPHGDSVIILPGYDANRPRFTGCGGSGDCPPQGASTVWLHTRPSGEAPLVKDVGRHPKGGSTYNVHDHAARASAGQRYARAGRENDWTAIWYLGQKAWFHDPKGARTSVRASGPLVTPRPGLPSVKLYGRAYPEPSAYPEGVEPQKLVPLQYSLPAGQRYSAGLTRRGSYLRAVTFDTSRHRVISGDTVYHQIQFGHRFMFVKASDVVLLRS